LSINAPLDNGELKGIQVMEIIYYITVQIFNSSTYSFISNRIRYSL
jgi:hypothetical protein